MAPRERDQQHLPSPSSHPAPECLAEPLQPDNITGWLKKKVTTDDIGDDKLWRIHDDLYDLTDFIQKHPGGAMWLEVTRGLDITEAYEASHVFEGKTDKILPKYHVRACTTPRKSRFTFHKDGFYKTIKRRAAEILKETGTGPSNQILLIQDALALSFHLCLLMLILAPKDAWATSWFWTLACGFTLGMNIACAHNFFHQRTDYFRRFYWDCSVLNSFDALGSHCLTHHMHTNTMQDLELTGVYPLANFYATDKNFVHKYLAPVYVHLFIFIAPILLFVRKFVETKRPIPGREEVMPMLQLAALLVFSNLCWSSCLTSWIIYHCMGGYWLVVTAVISTHHHPSVYHPGDHPCPETDWGLHQLDATNDTDKERFGGFFLSATSFGDHLLHHLFPTVDHSKLPQLYPVLERTCKEFGVFYRFADPLKMAVGLHTQLAREHPNNFKQRMELKP